MLKNIYEDSFSFGELFSNALSILVKNIKFILSIMFLAYIPMNLLGYFYGGNESYEVLIASVIAGFIGIIATIFVIILVKNDIDNETKDFKELLQLSLQKWLSVIVGSIIYIFIVILGTIFFIIPGIFIAVSWMFFTYAIVIKDIKLMKSFDYSWKLVKGRWFEIFGYLLFAIVSILVVSILLSYIPTFEIIYVTMVTEFLGNLFAIFITIIFTLKFINIDRTESMKEDEGKKEVIEL